RTRCKRQDSWRPCLTDLGSEIRHVERAFEEAFGVPLRDVVEEYRRVRACSRNAYRIPLAHCGLEFPSISADDDGIFSHQGHVTCSDRHVLGPFRRGPPKIATVYHVEIANRGLYRLEVAPGSASRV